MEKPVRQRLAVGLVGALVLGSIAAGAGAASAYQPSSSNLYVATDPGSCNKSPCILYPKSAQLPSGRLVAAFEDSQGPVIGQDMPIFKSDDYGDTWQKLADLKAPAYVSDDPAYAPYTSNWTNPYFYVLPEALGSYPAGTLILANVVSPGTTTNNDRLASAIFLWASTDEGATWEIATKVVASPLSYTGVSGDTAWQDPTWEPYLMMRNGKLVVYYSDERDAFGYDAATGVVQFDPADASSADSGGQILAHTTWDGVGTWTAPVVDVAGLTEIHDGKTKIGGGRPGMTNIVPTTDGKWLLTYEYWGGGDNVRYKIADDPQNFRSVGGAAGLPISQLPVAGGSARLAQGGSSVMIARPDGAIVYNAAGSGSVWVNESGRSDGVWKQYQTTVPAGYSRNLQYVEGTGRIHILQAPWGTGPVSHASLDLGHSEGAYYSLVNRKTGEILSTAQDKTQDPPFTGDQPDIITWTNNPNNDTQRWHVQPKGSNVTFLNKAGGRALGIWWGAADPNQPLSQWVDDNGSDKLWKLVPTSDGYVKIQSTKNTSLFISGTGSGGQVRLATNVDGASNPAADDAQEWKLVQQAPVASALSARNQVTSLVAAESVEAGATLQLDAAVADPAAAKTHANVAGHAYAITGGAAAVDLGAVAFDANEKGSVVLPGTVVPASGVRIVVQFDASATVWDSVNVVAPVPASVNPAVTATGPAGQSGWVRGAATVSFTTTGSDVAAQYRLAGSGDWLDGSQPYTRTDEGTATVEYRAVKAGEPVAGTEGTVDVKVDSVAPVTSPSVNPASGTVTVGQTITATFEATDATSGVAYTEYSLDGGTTWVRAASSGVSFTEKGSHQVAYRSVDVAGNVETARTVVLTVSEPKVTAAVKITSSDAPTADGWYQQSVIVALTPAEAGQKVQYRINAGAWKTYSSSITVSASGVTAIDHRLLKNNVVVGGSDAQTVVKVDKTLPVASASRTPGSGTGTPLNPISVAFGATDTNSGVEKVQYRVNNGEWVTAADAVQLDVVGDYVVSYRAVDLAGNVSATKSLTVKIVAAPDASVKASVKKVKAGDAVTLTLAGFQRWDDVAVSLGGTQLAVVMADVNGAAKVTVRVPASTAAGSQSFKATSSDGSIIATVGVTVTR